MILLRARYKYNNFHRESNVYWTVHHCNSLRMQQHSRKLLMRDILMSETCWAHKKWNKIASDIELVFHSSTFIGKLIQKSSQHYPGPKLHSNKLRRLLNILLFHFQRTAVVCIYIIIIFHYVITSILLRKNYVFPPVSLLQKMGSVSLPPKKHACPPYC